MDVNVDVVQEARASLREAEDGLKQLQEARQGIPQLLKQAASKMDAAALSAVRRHASELEDQISVQKIVASQRGLELIGAELDDLRTGEPAGGVAVGQAQEELGAALLATEEAQKHYRIASGNLQALQLQISMLNQRRGDAQKELNKALLDAAGEATSNTSNISTKGETLL